MFRSEEHGPIVRLRMARTALGRPIHEVSAYLVGGLLIDTGPPETSERLLAWCRERVVERIVLTHHHEDHAGGAAVLSRGLGLEIEAPAGALPILVEGARLPLYRRLVWGRPQTVRARALGEIIACGGFRFRVVPTPGHAFDHVCLFEEELRWLFAGDLFVHERVKLLRRIEDVRVHLESLRAILALEPELLVCSHAGIVSDARGALARKIAWWEGLADRARRLQAEGLSVRHITRELLGREGLLTWLSFGDFSKKNLIRDLLRPA